MEEIRILITEENVRLDAYLAANSELSRSNIQRLIKEGKVLLNGQETSSKYKTQLNDEAVIYFDEPEELEIRPVEMPLDIVYEDIVHGLLAHCHDLSGINGKLRPGIVHRIDKDTSGLLVCAKNDKTHIALSAQLANKECYRKYVAIAKGVFEHDEGIIDAPIGRDPKDRQKMTVTDKNSKEAITLFKVLKRFDDSTLVRLELKTGRTHQIRVHLKYINHPVLNDPKYGKAHLIDDSGQYLHAYYLSFIHPTLNKRVEFEIPLPFYMEEYIKRKENGYEPESL